MLDRARRRAADRDRLHAGVDAEDERRHRPSGRARRDARARERRAARRRSRSSASRERIAAARAAPAWSCPASRSRSSATGSTSAPRRRTRPREPRRAAIAAGTLRSRPATHAQARADRRRPARDGTGTRRRPATVGHDRHATTAPRRRRAQRTRPTAQTTPDADRDQRRPATPAAGTRRRHDAADRRRADASRATTRRRRAAAGAVTGGHAAAAADRPPHRPALRLLPRSCSASPARARRGSATVEGGALKRAAATPAGRRRRRPRAARHDHRPQRRRARGLRAGRRRRRHARTSSRTRARRPRSSRRCSAAATSALLKKLARRDTGFVYLARRLPADARGEGRSKLEHRRASRSRRPAAASTRATGWPRRCIGNVGDRRQRACRGSSTPHDDVLHGTRRQAPDRQATRSASRSRVRDAKRAAPGTTLRLTHRRRDPGARSRRCSAGSGRLPPEGRDRDRHGPAHRRDPRARQLAARRTRTTSRARRRTRARTARSARPTSPARRSRRSRSPARSRTASRHARHVVRPARRRSRSPTATIGEAHARGCGDAHDRADPRAVEQRRRDHDRAEARRASASTSWVRRFGFGTPTGVDLPGEERGHRARRSSEYSGSSIGNLPIGQGLAVTPMQMAAAYAAIANGGMLAPPQHRRIGRRRAAAPPAARRVISRRTAAQRARDAARACSAPGGTAQRGRDPRLRARGQDRHREQGRPDDRRVLGDALRRLVRRLRAGARARSCSSRSMVDEPQGDDLRRPGRRAGVPARSSRFALPYLRIPPR